MLDFQISFTGRKETNFDNKYYTFKLHRYTNIRDFNTSLEVTPKAQDVDIPLKLCKDVFEFDGNWDLSAPTFCPDFKDTDILRGSYYTKKYSWLRLAVHRCDPNDLIMKNGRKVRKTCASKSEQDEFFKNNILSLFLTK